METLRSPITGSGGGLPGTGRAPAILPAPHPAPTSEGSEAAAAPSFGEVAGELFAELAPPQPVAPPTTFPEELELPDPVLAPGVPVADQEVPPSGPPPELLPAAGPGVTTALSGATPVPGQPAPTNPRAELRSQAPAPAAVNGSPPAGPELPAPAPLSDPPVAPPTPFVVEDGGPETPLPESPPATASEAGPEALAAPEGASRAPGDTSVTSTASNALPADHAAVERAAEVLRQIQAELRPGARRIRVDLDPPELGRLVIRAALVEGKVTAVVEAESAATLDLLERQAPELLAALREAGVEARSLSLELSSNHSRGQGSGQGTETKHTPFQPTKDVEQDERADRREYRTRPSNAGDGVDTYA